MNMTGTKTEKVIQQIAKIHFKHWTYVSDEYFFITHKGILISIRSDGAGTDVLVINGIMFRNNAISSLWSNIFEYHQSKQRDIVQNTDMNTVYDSPQKRDGRHKN